MVKVIIDEDIELTRRHKQGFWQELIIGDLNDWIKKQIEPTLLENEIKKNDTQRNTTKIESI